MPTGYTYPVQDGTITTLRDFALRCAGAFVRGDDDQLPVELKVSPYHAERLVEAEAELAKLLNMTDSEADEQAHTAYLKALEAYEKSEVDRAAINARYESMLAKVEAWECPSPDHKVFHEFMKQQLRDSHKWDQWTPRPPQRQTGAEWLEVKEEDARYNVGYHRAEQIKEEHRVASMNLWLKTLRASLENAQ
jgi:hypothetical protein